MRQKKILLAVLVVVFLLLVAVVVALSVRLFKNKGGAPSGGKATPAVSTEESTTEDSSKKEEAIKLADRHAAMYDYDKAKEIIEALPDSATDPELQEKLKHYESLREKLRKWPDNYKISHLFFHSLIVDPTLAFDGDYKQADYNQVMCTVSEFEKVIQQMYDRGFVLVRITDIAKLQKTSDGKEKMVFQPIYLPEGKTPFVLSQDDINYYEYMKGDGFATRLLLDDKGKVINEYIDKEGKVHYGSYDLPPLLDDFIDKHPDFSYRGAKACLAVTGYNGVFGYRTSEFKYGPNSKHPNPNIEADRETVKKISAALRADGFEIASHSWGHINLETCKMDHFIHDANLWNTEVAPLVGGSDIFIFPFGADIGGWRRYQGERFEYLEKLGFRYFINVDASVPYWIQIKDNYFRQGRINVDGYRIWESISTKKDRLKPFFDAKSVIDPLRPTPVPPM